MVLELIEEWIATGLIKRFGVVVRHRELGYQANAMCVWDVPDEEVRRGRCEARPGTARDPLLPAHAGAAGLAVQPLLHGARPPPRRRRARDRGDPRARCGLAGYPSAVLFSLRCFKQRGARYLEAEREPELAHG